MRTKSIQYPIKICSQCHTTYYSEDGRWARCPDCDEVANSQPNLSVSKILKDPPLPSLRECRACHGMFLGTDHKLFCDEHCRVNSYDTDPRSLQPLSCLLCDEQFLDTKCNGQKYCSLRCSAIHRSILNQIDHDNCMECGSPFTRVQSAIFCSQACAKAAGSRRRRARLREAFVEDVALFDLYNAANGQCMLCLATIDLDLAYPNPLSPSVDHIKPLIKGGLHSRENLQIAHLSCNRKKWFHFDELLSA
jgi:5-methylcytosine-specific restriction endonuclease McrA